MGRPDNALEGQQLNEFQLVNDILKYLNQKYIKEISK